MYPPPPPFLTKYPAVLKNYARFSSDMGNVKRLGVILFNDINSDSVTLRSLVWLLRIEKRSSRVILSLLASIVG